MGFDKKCCWVGLDKNGVKTPVCFSEPSAYCCGSHFPYESKLSTESPPHISSGAHATQKNKLAINRDKPLGLANVTTTRKIDTAKNRKPLGANCPLGDKCVKSISTTFSNVSILYCLRHVPNVFSVYCPIVGKCCFAAPIYLFNGGCREFSLVKPTLNK